MVRYNNTLSKALYCLDSFVHLFTFMKQFCLYLLTHTCSSMPVYVYSSFLYKCSTCSFTCTPILHLDSCPITWAPVHFHLDQSNYLCTWLIISTPIHSFVYLSTYLYIYSFGFVLVHWNSTCNSYADNNNSDKNNNNTSNTHTNNNNDKYLLWGI